MSAAEGKDGGGETKGGESKGGETDLSSGGSTLFSRVRDFCMGQVA